jgi:hypothetical protein
MPANIHNAFISYAWVDNEQCVDERNGWVGMFHDRLRALLARELRRQTEAERIWIDYERMRGNEPLSDAIRREISSSRLLVPIISPSYFASVWCRQELETFLGLHGKSTDRIFPVWMERFGPGEIPAEARPLAAFIDERLKYQFWYEDEKRRVHTRHFPQVDPADREFGYMQQQMAREMAGVLRQIIRQEQPGQPLPESAQVPTCVIEGQHLIMINGGEADADEVLRVAKRLWDDHRVGSVIPLVAQKNRPGLKPSEITKDLRDNLAMCTAVLLLYCAGPNQQVYQQLKEYQRAVAKLPSGKRPPGLILCHGTPAVLTFYPPGMRVLRVDGDCAGDCLREFIKEFAK